MMMIVVDVCTKTKYIGPKLFDAKLCEFIGNEKLQQMIMMPKITPRLVHPAVEVNQGGNVQPGNPGDSGTSSDEQPLLFQKYFFTMITTIITKNIVTDLSSTTMMVTFIKNNGSSLPR